MTQRQPASADQHRAPSDAWRGGGAHRPGAMTAPAVSRSPLADVEVEELAPPSKRSSTSPAAVWTSLQLETLAVAWPGLWMSLQLETPRPPSTPKRSQGGKTRVWSTAQRRAATLSSGGHCQFPGCGRRIADLLHRHHHHHWADGRTTDLDNGYLA